MPVVATLTIITLLRGGAEAGPFFDAQTLREALIDGLDGNADNTELERSLAIADQLEEALDRYRTSVDRGMDVYIAAFKDADVSASDLMSHLEPIDRERKSILNRVIAYRGQLKDALDQAAWDKVFG